jgi:diacylglycerol kinase family enzyme
MGGDGVVHHVANGLIGTETALGIIPAGTTNVVARIHGTPRDPRKAAKALLDTAPKATDVVHVTTDSDAGARSEYGLFSVGVGFDADVVEMAEQRPHSKLWFGSIHFARAALSRVAGPYRRRKPDMTVSTGADSVRAVSVFVQVHDLYTYFGRLPMRLTHGLQSGPAAAALERLDPITASRIVTRLATQRDLAALPAVRRWVGFDRLAVAADHVVPFQADGEHLGHARSVQIEPLSEALVMMQGN